nr:MAG: hypothetical protein DIU78_12220 [Pseudomonadota bacterium]
MLTVAKYVAASGGSRALQSRDVIARDIAAAITSRRFSARSRSTNTARESDADNGTDLAAARLTKAPPTNAKRGPSTKANGISDTNANGASDEGHGRSLTDDGHGRR